VICERLLLRGRASVQLQAYIPPAHFSINKMRYKNVHFTYLLIYLFTYLLIFGLSASLTICNGCRACVDAMGCGSDSDCGELYRVYRPNKTLYSTMFLYSENRDVEYCFLPPSKCFSSIFYFTFQLHILTPKHDASLL